jgi:hypothetical protein
MWKEESRIGISGVFAVADGDHFTVEIFQEFRKLLLSAFNHAGNLHIVQSANHRPAGNALDKTKLLPGFGRDMNSLEFVVFT